MNQPPSLLRLASQWVVGIVLTVVLLLFLVALAAAQITSSGTGQRILRRSVAISTEIDRVLLRIQADLRAAAPKTDGDTVRVPNFPIPVDVSRSEAATLEGAALRQRLLDVAARRLYDDGSSAWAAGDPAAHQDVERISSAGAVKRGLGLITDSTHQVLLVLTLLLGAMALIMGGALLVSVRWQFRLLALGSVILASSLPLLAAAVGLRFAFRTAQPDADPFFRALLDVGIDAMWVPIRDYLTMSGLGFAILALAAGVLWYEGRRSRALPPLPDAPPEASV